MLARGWAGVSSNSQTRLTPAGHIDFRKLLHSQIFSRLRVGGFLCHSYTDSSIVYRGIFQIFKYILYSGKSLLSTLSSLGSKNCLANLSTLPLRGARNFSVIRHRNSSRKITEKLLAPLTREISPLDCGE